MDIKRFATVPNNGASLRLGEQSSLLFVALLRPHDPLGTLFLIRIPSHLFHPWFGPGQGSEAIYSLRRVPVIRFAALPAFPGRRLGGSGQAPTWSRSTRMPRGCCGLVAPAGPVETQCSFFESLECRPVPRLTVLVTFGPLHKAQLVKRFCETQSAVTAGRG